MLCAISYLRQNANNEQHITNQQEYNETMCKSIMQIVMLLGVFMLPACSTLTDTANLSAPAGKECKTDCNMLTDDHRACLHWSGKASEACKEKYSAVQKCCTNVSTCNLQAPAAVDTLCNCPTMGPRGMVLAQGVACK